MTLSNIAAKLESEAMLKTSSSYVSSQLYRNQQGGKVQRPRQQEGQVRVDDGRRRTSKYLGQFNLLKVGIPDILMCIQYKCRGGSRLWLCEWPCDAMLKAQTCSSGCDALNVVQSVQHFMKRSVICCSFAVAAQ